MDASRRSSERPLRSASLLLVVACVLAVAGVYLLIAGGWGRTSPTPSEVGADAVPTPAAVSARRAGAAPARPAHPVHPVSVAIPAIGVRSGLMDLHLLADRTLEVPPPARANTAGWYVGSPAPGERGASVIVGHVDSLEGPAVFYDLSALDAGDRVRVRRDDGRTAVFSVDKVASYRKSAFPTKAVYGRTSAPALRLITCGGPYVREAGGYQNNTVVYASLVRLTS